MRHSVLRFVVKEMQSEKTLPREPPRFICGDSILFSSSVFELEMGQK